MASFHKTAVYKPLAVKNPFEAQDAVYRDILEGERVSKKRWRLVALVAQLFFLASLGILYYAVSMQRVVPVLVAVAQWGEAQYLGEVKSSSSLNVPEVAIHYQMRDFITCFRSISSDSDILYANITHIYDMLTAKGEKKVTTELRASDPFSKVGALKKTISIETVLRLSTETYQVDWVETTTGRENRSVHIRGLFTVKLLQPPDKRRAFNPLGIYIDDYDMTELETRRTEK